MLANTKRKSTNNAKKFLNDRTLKALKPANDATTYDVMEKRTDGFGVRKAAIGFPSATGLGALGLMGRRRKLRTRTTESIT